MTAPNVAVGVLPAGVIGVPLVCEVARVACCEADGALGMLLAEMVLSDEVWRFISAMIAKMSQFLSMFEVEDIVVVDKLALMICKF